MMNSETESLKGHVIRIALVLGLVHAVVDASCMAILTAQGNSSSAPYVSEAMFSVSQTGLWDAYLVYNIMAFATQFTFGAFADRGRTYRGMALAGLAALAVAVAISPMTPRVAVVLAGLGNAAFHVGAGAMVLRSAPDRAAAASLFVAPGAVGLALGKWCAETLDFWPWLSVGSIAAGVGAVIICCAISSPSPAVNTRRPLLIGRKVATLCVVAILASIALRSTSGQAISNFYQNPISSEPQAAILWGLAIAAFAGKALGGFVSDRLGWIRPNVLALLVAAPLVSFYLANASAALVGMMLSQMAMPVTLLAVYRIMPQEPGLAFGLTALAVLCGAIPFLVVPASQFTSPLFILILLLTSLVAFLVGLLPIRPH
jgi:MFS transporter, FSR family, fosmidomycin resistance protein